MLERAVEEEPSEIFVKHEIPFDLSLAGSLMEEIRLLLIDEFEGYSHLSNLPTLKVLQLDDITSGLSLLKDYVSTMSSDITRNIDKKKRLVNQLKEEVASLQAQAKENDEKRHELEDELEMKESDLASYTQRIQLITEENDKLRSQILEYREQVIITISN